ncbi:MAG: NAD-dependent epimerase/dehydratase family protein [Zetaproteobacteria bacterium]|nr:MAG: NAD-dependent epimerase/dehydratase family protein [Zetaproteobacteria bacterium]
MRVLITGASGFVGRHVCKVFKAHGAYVRALLRRKAHGPWDEHVQGRLPDQCPESALSGVDCVVHLAGRAHALADSARDAASYFSLNTEGTIRLATEAVRQSIRRFVFVSTVKAADEPGARVADEGWNPWPSDPYGASKRAAEEALWALKDRLEIVILRPAMVYGPTEKGNLPRLIRACARGWLPRLPDSGHRRSMVHVEDLADAIWLAATHPRAAGEVFLVSDGRAYAIHEIDAWIREALGKKSLRLTLPVGAWRALAEIGEIMGRIAGRRMPWDRDAYQKLFGPALYDSGKIQNLLGFRPKRDLQTALPEIVDHLRRQGFL